MNKIDNLALQLISAALDFHIENAREQPDTLECFGGESAFEETVVVVDNMERFLHKSWNPAQK